MKKDNKKAPNVKLTDEQIEKIIKEVGVSHEMEGYILTEEDKDTMRKIAKGETTPQIELEKSVNDLKKKGLIK